MTKAVLLLVVGGIAITCLYYFGRCRHVDQDGIPTWIPEWDREHGKIVARCLDCGALSPEGGWPMGRTR